MSWVLANLPTIAGHLLAHLLQAVPAIVASFVLAIPIARLARVARPLRAVLVTGSSLLYAVPSLALFVILPIILATGIRDPLNVIVALTLYGLALLVPATADALDAVDVRVLDAATAMCRLIASCHDEAGDVAVAGLVSRSQAEADFPDYPEADFRADAGILDGVELTGTGDLTARLWTKPSLTLIGMDVTPLDLAGNVLTPSCTARLSLRIAPGQDPAAAQEALVAHLEKHVPFGGRLTVNGREAGPAFDGPEVTPASEAAHWALSTARHTEAVNIGQGGSIPFIATLKETFPGAQVLVTGIEDPDTRAHSENESMHLGELEHIVVAEALLLARLSGAIGS